MGLRPSVARYSFAFFPAAQAAGAAVSCVAAALGRPLRLGGWDLARGGHNGHKSMRAFVPAGSVFFFESDVPLAAPRAFTENPGGELSFESQGFGACVAAPWNWAATL